MRTLNRITLKRSIKKDDVLEKFAKILEANPPTREDEPETVVHCDVCQDRGWVVDSEAKPIDCPAYCGSAQAIQRKRQQVQFNRMMTKLDRKANPMKGRLSTYKPCNTHQSDALRASKAFIGDGDIGFANGNVFKRSIVFVGQVGSGKTHIVSAIGNELAHNGKNVWYMKFGEMIRRVNACLDDSIGIPQIEVIHALQYVDVLILDDVGRDNVTGATKDLFFDIIDARYDIDLPTIITTNLDQQQMNTVFSERIESRLTHMAHWIRLDGNTRDQTGVL